MEFVLLLNDMAFKYNTEEDGNVRNKTESPNTNKVDSSASDLRKSLVHIRALMFLIYILELLTRTGAIETGTDEAIRNDMSTIRRQRGTQNKRNSSCSPVLRHAQYHGIWWAFCF